MLLARYYMKVYLESADSKSYVTLTKIYHDRAAKDRKRFKTILNDLCNANQLDLPEDTTINSFCNNIPNIKGMCLSLIRLTQHFNNEKNVFLS